MMHDARGPRPIPTLEMVAELAGVSRATVSRVVNESPRVKPEHVQAVKKAVHALDYTPNRAARSLVKRRANAVTLIVPESTSKVFADPFFASVVQGIARYLTTTDYTLNMVISSESTPEKTRSFLLGGNVDGVLVVSHHSGDRTWTQLLGSLPMVFAGRPLTGGEESYYVETDNEQAAYGISRLLTESGRKHVATIAGPQDMPPGVDRRAGWLTAVREAGLGEELQEYGDFSLLSGTAAMNRLLDRGVPIDAVFAANDQMAAGAYTAIKNRGLRIPQDIAVAGFDDDSFATAVTPPLTTVHHPIEELGEKMARTLVKLIEGKATERVTQISTSLVIRESV